MESLAKTKILPIGGIFFIRKEGVYAMRFEYVPGKMKEKVFWRNYFYRVSLVRKQMNVSPLNAESIEL